MTTYQCPTCKHFEPGESKCKAFPNGIPVEILTGGYDHTKPFHGDRGVRWEKYDQKEPAGR